MVVAVAALNRDCCHGNSNAERNIAAYVNPLTPKLNPSAQRYLTRFFTGDFAS
jgi:hypothetical protein